MNGAETFRLKVLHDAAQRELAEAAKKLTETQLAVSKARTHFFEKLSLGAGASIVAMVSFLATHVGKLQPPWLLRAFLVSLVATVMFSLYRNYFYSDYEIFVRHRTHLEASIEEQERRGAAMISVPKKLYDWETGLQLNRTQTAKDLAESTEEGRDLLGKWTTKERHRLLNWQCAEWICLAATCIAAVSLVWLALANF